MSSFNYDNPKYEQMNNFLNYVLYMFKSSYLSSSSLDKCTSAVYSCLRNSGLKENDVDRNGQGKDIMRYFSYWRENFRNVDNIYAFHDLNWEHFFQFINHPHEKDINSGDCRYIKLYIPLDQEHLYEGVNQIFKYMADNNIYHDSKVARILRSDNVIVRLQGNDLENAYKLINFINSNKYIKEGLNSPNPFVPTVDGIGIMKENGISYNYELAECMAEFIRRHINDESISLEQFSEEMPNLTHNSEVLDVFADATGIERNRGLIHEQKQALLVDAMKATYQKYGMKQVEKALRSALEKKDYYYFTDGPKRLRTKLKADMDRNSISRCILDAIQANPSYNADEMSYDEIISAYCDMQLKDEQMLNFDEICSVTLENHGRDWLNASISGFIKDESPNRFSRFSSKPENSGINYRKMVSTFTSESMKNTLERSLNAKGIDTTEMSTTDMITTYTETLEKSKYENKGNSR